MAWGKSWLRKGSIQSHNINKKTVTAQPLQPFNVWHVLNMYKKDDLNFMTRRCKNKIDDNYHYIQ